MSDDSSTAGAVPLPSKHTPGPWVEFADRGVTLAIMPAIRGGDVCVFAAPYPTREDARLIAAAPDLLAELKVLRKRFHACCVTAGNDPETADLACASADAALAKAGG